MNGEKSWEKIIKELKENPAEISTVPSNNKEHLCFKAYFENETVYVDNSFTRLPSTKMSQRRKIMKKDFMTVYEYYHRWANGETYLRQEVRLLSRNTAYIFALIAHVE